MVIWVIWPHSDLSHQGLFSICKLMLLFILQTHSWYSSPRALWLVKCVGWEDVGYIKKESDRITQEKIQFCCLERKSLILDNTQNTIHPQKDTSTKEKVIMINIDVNSHWLDWQQLTGDNGLLVALFKNFRFRERLKNQIFLDPPVLFTVWLSRTTFKNSRF